ncbi:hypothetical protein CPB86DRAFT_869221 [Serendipita vermifera]|nr:hypothetical protein CPB86DRAFT_869221 [Serendipita vermifera]
MSSRPNHQSDINAHSMNDVDDKELLILPIASQKPSTPPTVATTLLQGASTSLLKDQNSPGDNHTFVTSHKLEGPSNSTTNNVLANEKWKFSLGPQRTRTEEMEAGKRTKRKSSIRTRWNQVVRSGSMWPRILYGLVGIALAGIWVGIIASFARNEKDYQERDVGRDVYEHAQDNPRKSGKLLWLNQDERFQIYWFLTGGLQRFDPISRRLNINWALDWKFSYRAGTIGDEIYKVTDIGIYRDQDLVPVNSSYERFSPNSVDEIFDTRVSNVSATPIMILGLNPWESFSTEIDMKQQEIGSPWTQPQLGFPFDRWFGRITFVANAWGYAREANVPSTARGIEIDDAIIQDSLMHWRITLVSKNTCVKRDSEGTSWVWATPNPCRLDLRFTAERTSLVKFATVVSVTVNWISTIFIFIMTCEGVIMQRFQILMAPQLLAVCPTSLFALPSVRAILPGAPDFGALIGGSSPLMNIKRD